MLVIKCYLYYRSCTTKNRSRCIDAHFEGGVGSVSLPLFTIKAANTLFMTLYNLSPSRLPKIHNQQSLTLRWLVLATVPKWRFGSGSGLEPNWNRCNGFYPIKKPIRSEPAVFWPVPHCRKLTTLAPIKYLSSDRITIWYIRKRCSFWCSFTTHSPICDPITIHCVTLKNAQFLAQFHSNSTNSDLITNWRMGGERASRTASFTYISYCDTIRTQILNWSQSSEFAKMKLCSRIIPAKKPRVYVRSG